MDTLEYKFEGDVWLWSGKKTDWWFITLPKEMSDHARFFTAHVQRGFKSLNVDAQIGGSQWQTSMFPSKERQAYLLPIKKAVRDAEGIEVGKTQKVKVTVLGL
ncbi:MAG: DUF1905 domain-containing protein [Parvibaculales bacterium]